MGTLFLLVAASALLAATDAAVVDRPFWGTPKPQCNVTWIIQPPDDEYSTQDKVEAVLRAWSDNDCGTGQKCNYKMEKPEFRWSGHVHATHTSPIDGHVDDLTMEFSE